MLKELRPSELGEWAALARVDPWGEQRADLRAAIIASTVANVMVKKRDGSAFKPADFMPYLEKSAAQDSAELSRRLRAALAAVSTRKRKG